MKSRSGTSRSYAERIAKGRPNRTFSLSDEVDWLINRLAAKLGKSRSAVIDEAVHDLAKKHR